MLQEAHGNLADLCFLPPTHLVVGLCSSEDREHAYIGGVGDLGVEEASSLWGGVLVAGSRRVMALAVHSWCEALCRGHIFQVDVDFRPGGLRIICVHVDPTRAMAELRRTFLEIRACFLEATSILCLP